MNQRGNKIMIVGVSENIICLQKTKNQFFCVVLLRITLESGILWCGKEYHFSGINGSKPFEWAILSKNNFRYVISRQYSPILPKKVNKQISNENASYFEVQQTRFPQGQYQGTLILQCPSISFSVEPLTSAIHLNSLFGMIVYTFFCKISDREREYHVEGENGLSDRFLAKSIKKCFKFSMVQNLWGFVV